MPGVPVKEGVGNVAKTLHEAIIANFPKHVVIYTDPSQMQEVGELKNVEWLFTVPRDLVRAQKKFSPMNTILFTANESALSRFEVWVYSRKNKINRKMLGGHDGIFVDFREDRADYVISLGGWNSYSSYLRSGFPPDKVITTGINYPYPREERNRAQSGKYVIWFMGLICVRKGILNLGKILETIDAFHPNYKLRLIGYTDSEEMRGFVQNELLHASQGHEWIDKKIFYGTPDWDLLRDEVAFGIFPSREEGLPGCVLDLINLKIPVIYSSKCGLNFVNQEVSQIDFLQPAWEERLSLLLAKAPQDWLEIAKLQEDIAFLTLEDNQIERIINRLSKGNMWPTISSKENEFGEYVEIQSAPRFLDLLVYYRGPILNDELKTKLLLLELDKHSSFRSAGFCDYGITQSESCISLFRRGEEKHANPRNIPIYIVDELNSLTEFSNVFKMRKRLHYFLYLTVVLAKRLIRNV